MKKLFDGFIFDIDGTLTSTNQLIFDSFNFIAKKYLNKTFTDEEIVAMFGPTEDVILKEWCRENFEEARAEYYKYYSDNHWMAKLYPGIKEVLDYLKSKNILGPGLQYYCSTQVLPGNSVVASPLMKPGSYYLILKS